MKNYPTTKFLHQWTRREWLGTVAASAFTGLSATGLHAQDNYPNKPVTLIVPYPPGGNNDIVARAYATPLSKAIGQPVVVENKGGAAGAIGVGQAAKAAPDGYNMVIGDLGSLCINPHSKSVIGIFHFARFHAYFNNRLCLHRHHWSQRFTS